MRAPTTFALIDNLTRGELVEYKPIGDLMAFVGDENFEVSYNMSPDGTHLVPQL